ncbi:retrovirus-related pol polyprotein from transposon TNT 1-94 [Tanacetum coccineum]
MNPRVTKHTNECKYCGSNKHHPDECEFYPGCEICGGIAHEIADCPKNLRNSRKQRVANKQSTKPTDKYSKECGPKVVFGDNSLGNTEGYGSVNFNGITFTMVSYVNGLKHNLISINQLYDANFKVLFTKTLGTIFNQNDKVILIAPRRRDVYVIDMSSYNKGSNARFFAKASPSINWLWHKRLSHLNFKNINNLTKHNLVSGLPSLTFSKDKNYSACEIGKHHRETVKTKSEDNEAISQSSIKGNVINFNEVSSLPNDEFLEPINNDSLCTVNTEYFPYVPAFDRLSTNTPSGTSTPLGSLTPVEPPMVTFEDVTPTGLEAEHPKSDVDLNIDDLQEDTRVEQSSEVHLSPQINSPSSNNISDPHVAQDRWSREKHNELVNIIGEPLVGITTRSSVRDSEATSAHECLYVNFLFEIEPKKLIEALEEEGWELSGSGKTKRMKEGLLQRIKQGFTQKYDLDDYASMKCPMLPPNNLGPDKSGVSINETLFRGMIGSLMYLTTSRPDIQFSICLCARYQANLKESHLVVVKRIFRYLKGTQNLGLWYPKESGFDLKAYSDSNYVGCNLDRKTKALYVAAAGCYAQVIWIKSQLADYDVLYDKVLIFCDNTSAIAISNNLVLHSRTKHIDIREFWYTDKADTTTKIITFTLSCFDKPLLFDLDVFSFVIELKPSENFVSSPPKETVKAGLATLGLFNEKNPELSSTDLINSSLPSFSKRHMFKVADLSPEPLQTLIPPSGEVNADDIADKSLSRTSVPPVTQPKAPTVKRLRKKKIPSLTQPKVSPTNRIETSSPSPATHPQSTEEFVATADPPRCLEASELAEEKKDVGAHSLEVPTFEQLMDEVNKQNKSMSETPESPYDTESGIKFIKSFKVATIFGSLSIHLETDQTANANITFLGSRPTTIELDDSGSDLYSMPSDDMASLTGFETPLSANGDDALPNASAGVSAISNPFGHLHRERTTLSSKVDQMESRVTKDLSKVIKTKMSNSVRERVQKGMQYVNDRLFTVQDDIAHNTQRIDDMMELFRAMNFLLTDVVNEQAPPSSKLTNSKTALVIHPLKNKTSKANVSKEKDSVDEPPVKKLKQELSVKQFIDYLFNTTSSSFSPSPPREPTPLRDPSKGKGVTIEEPMKDLIPYMEEGGSEPKIQSRKSFITLEGVLSEEDNMAQLKEMADLLPIIKISYRVSSSQDATMRITRDNDPLNIMAKKLGVPPPLELANFGWSSKNKKRKRSEKLQEVFVKEDIVVDGMHRNLILPTGIIGRRGMIICEPKARIFYYNGNFDLAFQRESEFHLATTPQLIRLQPDITRGAPEAEDMYNLLSLTIKARNDAEEARKIVKDNLDGNGL